jgi:parvulin-like peptidyl-prolyl isomerase
MQIQRWSLLLLLCCLPAYAEAPKVSDDAPIIEDARVKVDVGDVYAFLLRVPADRRATFRTSYDRVATVADNVFVTRSFAERARAEGLDKDPVLTRRLRQAEDAVLADRYVEKLQAESVTANLDARARELYLLDPKAFASPEMVTLQHILVDLHGRSREEARARAEEVEREAQAANADFLTLAGRYSDDPLKTRTGGAMDPMPIEALPPATRAAVEKLKKGGVSEPIATDNGFEIYRLVDRRPPQTPKFEAVKDRIIASERERMAKQRVDLAVQEVRSSATVITHRDNLEALVVPVDTEALNRRQAELAAEAERAAKAQDAKK